jgi:hypothetical protein
MDCRVYSATNGTAAHVKNAGPFVMNIIVWSASLESAPSDAQYAAKPEARFIITRKTLRRAIMSALFAAATRQLKIEILGRLEWDFWG